MTKKHSKTLAAMTARAGRPAGSDILRVSPDSGRQTEQQLRTLVEGVPHLIWRSCNLGLWTWSSPQWRAYTGQSQEESYGRGWLDVVHADDHERTTAAWAAAVDSGELDVEFRVHRAADGEWVWHRTTSLPVRDEAGRITEWLGSTTDIQSYKDLQRRQAESLAAVERHARELEAEVRRREQAEKRLHHVAYHDDLTGLCNRAWFMNKLELTLNDDRTAAPCSLLFLGLDRFKLVNDSFGHSAGDLLLVEVGRRLQECLREDDMLARFGGDEFAVLVTGKASMDAAARLTDAIQQAMLRPFWIGTLEVDVTSSIGVAHAAAGHFRLDHLVRDASIAMHEARANGPGNTTVFTAALRDKAIDELALEVALRDALFHERLSLRYQPICDAQTSAIMGIEALVRWRHAERGDVPPSVFIPVAEKAGLIRNLGRWVFRTACAQVSAWHERFPSMNLHLSVNASGQELRDPRYLSEVRGILAATGLDPRNLQVEVTESVFLRHPETTGEILDGLRALGIRVALDDFGTGYSALGYLGRYPVDTLKIDHSFVSGMLTHSGTRAVVDAIIQLGHALELSVVAEGVEEESQLRTLRASGCELVQGYLLGHPLSASELEALLHRQDRERALDAGDADLHRSS